MFLKNVAKVALYFKAKVGEEPRLLFAATRETPASPLRSVVTWLRKQGSDKGSKGMDRSELQHAARLRDFFPVSYIVEITAEGVAKLGQGEADTNGATAASAAEQWLVYSGIAPGSLLQMAGGKDAQKRGLLPWVALAARLDGPPSRGRAFVFLPLPILTGLPVHVNAYFELSSNRRELWGSHDLAGAGELRVRWNTVLVEEAVPHMYAAFLEQAAAHLGPGEGLWR